MLYIICINLNIFNLKKFIFVNTINYSLTFFLYLYYYIYINNFEYSIISFFSTSISNFQIF